MLAYQKMVATDGYEVALFPMEYLYMSQDEGGDFSHLNTYNIDFIGWGANGRIYKCPIYAPCTLKCVNTSFSPTNNSRTYESVNQVHLADGTIDYLTIYFMHDDTPLYNVGDVIEQGEILGHTGTTGNVTGDHTHSCCGKGKFNGFTNRDGNWDLTNRIHYWDAVYVNDTVIVRGFNHPWVNYDGTIEPPNPSPINRKKGKFNWVLYAKKLRNKPYF